MQVLAEAKRIQDRFASDLHLIYVGERTEETTRKFKEAFAELGLPADSIVHYGTGHPAEAILEAASNVDLVIAGALEKEVVLRPFLGDVARRLVREVARRPRRAGDQGRAARRRTRAHARPLHG